LRYNVDSHTQQLPRRKQAVTQDRSKVLRETEQNPFEAEEDNEDELPPPRSHSRQASLAQSSNRTSTPSPVVSLFSSSMAPAASKKSKKDKKGGKKAKAFNLEAEKETMKNCIAESSVASTNLLNALRLINREHEQISENQNVVRHFDFCKLLRRKILRYVSLSRSMNQKFANIRYQIQHVESEQWLGALLHANDELVTALMTFEQLDRSIDADSDSDDEMAEQAHLYKSKFIPKPHLWIPT